MTPKSLLRHPKVVSKVGKELANGSFQPVKMMLQFDPKKVEKISILFG